MNFSCHAIFALFFSFFPDNGQSIVTKVSNQKSNMMKAPHAYGGAHLSFLMHYQVVREMNGS